jgi:hypothetical protein
VERLKNNRLKVSNISKLATSHREPLEMATRVWSSLTIRVAASQVLVRQEFTGATTLKDMFDKGLAETVMGGSVGFE